MQITVEVSADTERQVDVTEFVKKEAAARDQFGSCLLVRDPRRDKPYYKRAAPSEMCRVS